MTIQAIGRFSILFCLWIIAAAAIIAPPSALAQAATTNAPQSSAHQMSAPGSTNARIDSAAITESINKELGIDLEATIDRFQSELDGIEHHLQHPHLNYTELNDIRGALQRIRSKVESLAKHVQPLLADAKSQLNLLGPAPTAAQPPEPAQVALSRAQLNYRLGLLTTAQATAHAADSRIDHLLSVVEDVRRSNFASILLQPIPGVYAYETWAKLPQNVPMATDHIRDLVVQWWQRVSDREAIVRIALEALFLSFVLTFAAQRGISRLRRWDEEAAPPFWRRASSAAGVILLRAAPVAIPVIFLYEMVGAAQRFPLRLDWLFYFAGQSVVIVFIVGALAITVFAPRAPQWRLIPASDAGAARICGLLILLAFVYSLTTLLYIITRIADAPFALTIAVALPSSLLLAGLVVAILRTPLQGAEDAALLRWLHLVRVPVWTVVGAIVVCALAGYLPLARFLAQQLIVTGSILALVYLLLLWVDGFMQSLSDDGTVLGGWLQLKTGMERKRREQLALPVSLLLKFAVLVLSVPFIMLQWGYTWPDIYEWYRQLFFRLHVGNTQVTFGALMASLIVFALGYAAARLFQGWLDARILEPAGISGGVRHSIRTGVGYAGILLAGLVAFSYAGFSLSSIAVIAGAFSIGIGFGLQNLVNNFVSGLILLAERPIRVGDLVVVGGEEGYVRKISVRSTQIETFDRSHVLIPNSYFISEKVKNWTFRYGARRIGIPIGVAYGSDPRQVQSVLIEVARQNSDVLAEPEPFVDLKEFGASSLNFILYVFTNDIAKTVKIRTSISMAILAAFADAGIEIPFPQTDVSIRNIELLREAVTSHEASTPVKGTANGGDRPIQTAPE
jgi:potassium-dependent mechanosensitive channel